VNPFPPSPPFTPDTQSLPRLISVAVPVPLLDALTYSVPPHLAIPHVGARVVVPVGSRKTTGVVVGAPAAPPENADLKDLIAIVDRDSLIPPPIVELCRWVAEYYLCGPGDALAAAMPPGTRKVVHGPTATGRPRRSGFRTRRVAALSIHGASHLQASDGGAGPASGLRPLTAKQVAALEALSSAPSGRPVSALRECGIAPDTLARLASRGLVLLRDEIDDRDPFEAAGPVAPIDTVRTLTSEQALAFDRLSALVDEARFKVALLRGVTGSGKTEVYLRLADYARRAGRQALLLVPEIALTPALAAAARAAFGASVAIQHSALSEGERHDQWHRIRRGEVDVVVGTRSAVFAPLPRVGLIVVDEEHDNSYKQEEAPRYNGRDVAIVRASREGALVVLGSATPSMETFHHAATGKYERLVLEKRVLERPLADVRVVDMREEYASEGPDVVISRALAAAVAERLARREQVMVLLNRRGYATAVFCRQCGDTFECPNCSVSLTVHLARGSRHPPRDPSQGRVEGRARCHYCNYTMRIPAVCRKCAAPYLEQAGFGTEKVEEQLAAQFPEARIARIDRDSIRRKGSLTTLLTRFAAGELDVLVGTQMIAKGHDFPNVTLVGVISADVGLGMADFRAAERTFQLLTQVAGRAGRGERPGEAIVQTLYPEHYSIRLARTQDYPAFFERELNYRRSMHYPPAVALINVVVRGRTLDEALGTAGDIARRLQPHCTAGRFTTLGPAPAPLVRLRGEHRAQLLLKGTLRARMREALKAVLAEMPEVRRRVTVDVDPLNVL
jgi:primosomal protein N' (replication factor Y) (superfamily II helicase)